MGELVDTDDVPKPFINTLKMIVAQIKIFAVQTSTNVAELFDTNFVHFEQGLGPWGGFHQVIDLALHFGYSWLRSTPHSIMIKQIAFD